MEENAKKTYKEQFIEAKAEIFGKLDELSPGFYHAMHNTEGKLHERRLENMAEWFARHADKFNKDQKTFMYRFVKVSVWYLDKSCPKSDFSFDGIIKLAKTADLKQRFERSTYEMLLERFMDRESEKLTDDERTIFIDLMKMCQPDYVHSEFSIVFDELLEKWKKLIYKDMINDEHYKEAYLYAKSILKKTRNMKRNLNEMKIQDHIEERGIFKFVDYDAENKNPRYDYEQFKGQLVRFSCLPEIGESAHWLWLGHEANLNVAHERWHTSPVINIRYYDEKMIIHTFNTRYEFEIHKEEEAE